jgi:hypothetical protein
MPDSVYNQALTQVVAGLNAIGMSNYSIATDSITIRKLNPADMRDWQDVGETGGVTVRWQDDLIEGEGTNERDAWGYPCHVCIVRGSRLQIAEETEPIFALKQAIKRYFNHKRRMSSVSDTGTLQIVSRVIDGPKPPPQVVADYSITTITVICWFLEKRTT